MDGLCSTDDADAEAGGPVVGPLSRSRAHRAVRNRGSTEGELGQLRFRLARPGGLVPPLTPREGGDRWLQGSDVGGGSRFMVGEPWLDARRRATLCTLNTWGTDGHVGEQNSHLRLVGVARPDCTQRHPHIHAEDTERNEHVKMAVRAKHRVHPSGPPRTSPTPGRPGAPAAPLAQTSQLPLVVVGFRRRGSHMAGGGNRRLGTAPRGPLPGGWPGTGTELQPGGGKAANGVVLRLSFPLASGGESSPWRGTLPTPSHSAGQGCLATNGAQQAIREARAGAKVPLTPADLRAWGAEGRARLVALGEGIVSENRP
jgi:hypothetical protein